VVHPEARAAFRSRADILYVPEFVANCGSVYDGNLPGDRAFNERLLRARFGAAVRKLLAESRRLGLTAGDLARRVAEDNVQAAQTSPASARAHERALRWTTRLAEHRFSPGATGNLVARYLAGRWTPHVG
jgi:hypothetical protein